MSRVAGGSVVSVAGVVGVAGVVRRVVGGSVVSVVGVAGVVSHVRVAGGRRAEAIGRDGRGGRMAEASSATTMCGDCAALVGEAFLPSREANEWF
ncbi:MAG: hypothetical protein ACJ8BW_06120 [Ktedonobacteraceae bacterium]